MLFGPTTVDMMNNLLLWILEPTTGNMVNHLLLWILSYQSMILTHSLKSRSNLIQMQMPKQVKPTISTTMLSSSSAHFLKKIPRV